MTHSNWEKDTERFISETRKNDLPDCHYHVSDRRFFIGCVVVTIIFIIIICVLAFVGSLYL